VCFYSKICDPLSQLRIQGLAKEHRTAKRYPGLRALVEISPRMVLDRHFMFIEEPKKALE
jgi:hypothetical protein